MSTDPETWFSEDGTPRSARFGDIYYAPESGLEETRHVFFKGCGLPELWAGRSRFTVAELGFGTGLNIAALLELWSRNRPSGARLDLFSLEGFLMPREAAARALSAFGELGAFSAAILDQWPSARLGFHYMDFPQWGARLTLALMPADEALAQWQGRADAWFLDGFSPALNPDMWSEGICRAIAASSAPGAVFATFTAAGFVKRNLMAAGFEVQKQPGYGRKRERLVGRLPGPQTAPPETHVRSLAVVGAGIAGASLAFHARQMGMDVTVFDAEGAGAGASGNRGGIATPRLDVGADDITGLFADALYYARDLYGRLAPEAVDLTGVELIAEGPREMGRFIRLSDHAAFSPGDLSITERGLRVATAMTLKPAPLIEALLDGQMPKLADLRSIRGEPGAFFLCDTDGREYGPFDAVALCLGEGALDWPGMAGQLALTPVRGQVEYVPGINGPDCAQSWGGYCAPLGDGLIFGATHRRGERGHEVRLEDCVTNLDALRQGRPDLADGLVPEALISRASVRVMSRDYLPVCGFLRPGIAMITGLGSRGFCLAPLLALHLAQVLNGGAAILPVRAQKRVDPQRSSVWISPASG